MKRLLIILFVATLVSACGGGEAPAAATSTPTRSAPSATAGVAEQATPSPEPAVTSTPSAQIAGVAGVALVGPACPVIRVDTPCPDRPWLGTVVVRTASGREVARTDTDADGRFTLVLNPGDYVVVTLTTGILPAPASVDVTVLDGEIAQVVLLLDSGIR
jgi:hypothetical protein